MESIRSFSFAKRIVVLFVLSFLVAMPMVGFVSSSAKASSTQDIMPIFNEDVYKKLTGHQHYYYLASCFRNNDIGKMGASDVDGWDFFNNDDRYDAAIGAMYGGDGSMDCKNGDNVSRAAGAVGTTLKAREAFCKMENAKYGGENVDTDAAYRVCVSGSTPDAQWDDDGSDNLVKQYESFRDNMGFKDPGLDDATQYMRAYSTLINGCNLKAEETVYDSWDKAVEGAKGESEIMPFVTMEKKGKNIVLQYRTGIGSRSDSSVILVATTGLYEPARGGAHGGVSAAKYPRTMRTCDQLAVDTNTYAAKYAQYVNTNGYTEGGNPDGGGGDPKSSCSIEGGLGWIICPVMNTLASINDTAFSALKNFLEIDAKVITNNDIKGAWEKFRDIANVAFIGAFLIVIYSQMTGTGISNYGIKKIIPRIVVAAVLINISFWVCAVMVDISNIVGSSIYNLLGDSINIGGGDSGHEGWNAVVGGLLTGGIVIALVAALILAPTVLLAVAVVLIILIARQAFVILLIAMSPLAFTAYLLPNTEQWFKKWWKAFVAVLMVYPTVGLVFGASTLASRVLGTSDDKLMQVAALAIMGIPLFAVPALLKGAMSAAGSIGQKLAGLQDRANKRGMRGIKEGRLGEAKAAFDARRASRKINRRLGQGRLAKWGQRGAVEDANGNTVYRSRRAAAAAWLGTRQKALDNSRASNYLGANRGAAAATAAYHKEVNEETERQQATMSEHGADDLLEIAKDTKQTAERRAAALRQLEHVGGHQHIQAAYDYLMQEGAAGGKDVGDVQQLAAKSLLSRRPAGVGKTQANALVNGKMKGEGYNDSLRQRLRDQKFDERSLAAMDVDDIARFAQMKAEGKLTDDDVEMLDSLDQLIKKNPNISMDGEKQHALDQALYGPMNPDGTQAAAPTNTRGSTYQEALIDLNMPSGG